MSCMAIQEVQKAEEQSKKLLIVSSSSLPGDFFAKEPLVIFCMIETRNEIKTTVLLDTGAIGYLFIDLLMIRFVCNKLQIESI